MSSIIQTVSVTQAEAKPLREKLGDHLGIHRLFLVLVGGERVEGVLSEVGKDYVCLIADEFDTVIPIDRILYFRFAR